MIYMEWAEMRNALQKCHQAIPQAQKQQQQQQDPRSQSTDQSIPKTVERMEKEAAPTLSEREQLKQFRYCKMIEDTTHMLVQQLNYKVYSKEKGIQMYWPDRLIWTDNIFLLKHSTINFKVTEKFPQPIQISK